MPSHRHELDAGGPALQLRAAALFPNYLLSCTPQAHCRSDSLNSYPLASLVDMDTWLTASGLETTTRNCGSPTALHNYQQQAEKPMGSVDTNPGIGTGNVFPQIGGYQSDTWWPPINAQMFPRDISTQRMHQPSLHSNFLMQQQLSTKANFLFVVWIFSRFVQL